VLAALSTGHQVGLGVAGLAFVVFALTSAIVIPRRNPDFPGNRLGIYVLVTFLFFVGMMTSVFIFGKEKGSPEHHENEPITTFAQSFPNA
jgi:hypothetical protein